MLGRGLNRTELFTLDTEVNLFRGELEEEEEKMALLLLLHLILQVKCFLCNDRLALL